MGKAITMADLEAINFPYYYNLVKEGEMKRKEAADLLFGKKSNRYNKYGRYVRFLEGKPTFTEAMKRRNKKQMEKKGKTPEQIKAEWKDKLKNMTEEEANQFFIKHMIRITKEDTVLIKRCPDCMEYRIVDGGFSKNKNQDDRISRICNECSGKRVKEHRETPEGKASHNRANHKYKQTPKGKAANKRQNHKRRLKEKESGGTWTLEEWNSCLAYFDYKDAYTGEPLTTTEMEHVIPVSKGGTNNIYNIVPANKSTNSSKNNSDVFEWYSKQPYFSWDRYLKICMWIIKNGGASRDINIKE